MKTLRGCSPARQRSKPSSGDTEVHPTDTRRVIPAQVSSKRHLALEADVSGGSQGRTGT